MPVHLRFRRNISFHDVAANVAAAGSAALAANAATVSAVNGGSSFPTFASTGPTASLTTATATTVSASTSWTGRDFVNGLDLSGVSNVTFTDCRIAGCQLGFVAASGRTFVRCDFDGDQFGAGSACGGVGGSGTTFTDCRFWNAAQGFNGGVGYFTDCYFGDLYITGLTHGEGVLISSDGTELDHCTILGHLKSGGAAYDPGGGLSAALALYNHGVFWGSRSDNYVHDCLFSAPGDAGDPETGPVYTVYWGTPGEPTNTLSNCRFENNTFRKVTGSTTSCYNNNPDIVSESNGGAGTTITGNVYEDSGLPVMGNV